MAFLQANIYSNILEMEVSLNVILPQKTEKKIGTASKGNSNDVPVMYLLHGMGEIIVYGNVGLRLNDMSLILESL